MQPILSSSTAAQPVFMRLRTACIALAFTAIFATPRAAQASTVVLQGGFGYPATHSADGAVMDPGFEVSVGTFASGFDPATAPSDLPALLAAWQEYGKTATATIDGVPGSFYLKHINNTPAFAGKKIYLLLTRTTNHASPAADGSNVTDYGVFSSSQAAWTFPLVGEDILPPRDLTQLNTAQIDSAHWGAADASSVTLAFKTGTNQSNSAWNDWVASVFGQSTDPSTIDPNAVSGSSGLKNFVAFALNANPTLPSAPPFTTVTGGDGRIGIEFTRKKASASGYSATAQASLNLSTWDLPTTETIIASTSDTETVRVFPAFPDGTDSSKAFFRIKVAPAGQN
ncbi:MAG: hypothetical protein WCG66_06855 [bacterium]